MTETPATFPKPDIPTIPYTGIECQKTDAEITCLEKNNIDEAIRQNLRKKNVYESDIHKIYNLIIGQNNEQIQDKAALDVTFQEIKNGR